MKTRTDLALAARVYLCKNSFDLGLFLTKKLKMCVRNWVTDFTAGQYHGNSKL